MMDITDGQKERNGERCRRGRRDSIRTSKIKERVMGKKKEGEKIRMTTGGKNDGDHKGREKLG